MQPVRFSTFKGQQGFSRQSHSILDHPGRNSWKELDFLECRRLKHSRSVKVVKRQVTDSEHISEEDILPSIKTPWKSQRRIFLALFWVHKPRNLFLILSNIVSDPQTSSSEFCWLYQQHIVFINMYIIKLQCIKTSCQVRALDYSLFLDRKVCQNILPFTWKGSRGSSRIIRSMLCVRASC